MKVASPHTRKRCRIAALRRWQEGKAPGVPRSAEPTFSVRLLPPSLPSCCATFRWHVIFSVKRPHLLPAFFRLLSLNFRCRVLRSSPPLFRPCSQPQKTKLGPHRGIWKGGKAGYLFYSGPYQAWLFIQVASWPGAWPGCLFIYSPPSTPQASRRRRRAGRWVLNSQNLPNPEFPRISPSRWES